MTDDPKQDDAKELDLPTLYKADLSTDKLDELLTDIQANSSWMEVRLRDASGGPGNVELIDIAELSVRLADSTRSSVQIRYGFEGKDWCDSILRTRDGFRLVRMEMPRSV